MSPLWRVPTPVRLNWQGRPIAVIVPVAVRSITLSLCSVPVRSAATFTPLAQLAVTVPPIDVAVCAVMSHFTSEQLPSGRPAIADDPHEPANADAAFEPEPPPLPVLEEPPDVFPAGPSLPDGAVGANSFEVFSNAQPVASVAASTRLKREIFFMFMPLQFCIGTHGSRVYSGRPRKIFRKNGKRLSRCRIKARTASASKTGRIRTMRRAIFTRPWLIITVFFALIVTTSGCRRRTAEVAEYTDPHPLPEEPLVVDAASIGKHGGRFVIAQTGNPRTFNGMMANENSSTDITTRNLFTTLVDYDNGAQKFVPMLAKSWEVAADGLTWTFDIRRGAKFSDGHPMTAEDVLFSAQVALDPVLHPAVQDQLQLDGKPFEFSAPDPYRVVLKTPKPFGTVLVSLGSLTIYPKHIS